MTHDEMKMNYASLARNLYAGYIAHRLGLRMATVERSYAKEMDSVSDSPLWLMFAQTVQDMCMKVYQANMDAALEPLKQERENVQ